MTDDDILPDDFPLPGKPVLADKPELDLRPITEAPQSKMNPFVIEQPVVEDNEP